MRGFTKGGNHFENSSLGALCATLLLQSFANPAVSLSAAEYQKLRQFFIDGAVTTVDVSELQMIMINISELMARGRRALASGSGSCLQALVIEAKELERSMNVLLVSTREGLRALDFQNRGRYHNFKMYAICQRVYGVALSASAMFFRARRTLSPQDSTLDAAATDLCSEVLRITHDARAFRPLGAVWTVHVLICTWCAIQDINLGAMIEEALLDYQRDAMGPKVELQMDQIKTLERRLSLVEYYGQAKNAFCGVCYANELA